MGKNYWRHQIGIREIVQLNSITNMVWPFVNLGIGTSALELELGLELELELILQMPLFQFH